MDMCVHLLNDRYRGQRLSTSNTSTACIMFRSPRPFDVCFKTVSVVSGHNREPHDDQAMRYSQPRKHGIVEQGSITRYREVGYIRHVLSRSVDAYLTFHSGSGFSSLLSPVARQGGTRKVNLIGLETTGQPIGALHSITKIWK